MILQKPKEQVLVLTSMNFTADLVAQELYKLEVMKKFVCRTYSSAREDVFNVRINDLPEYSVLFKMLFDSREIYDSFTNQKTSVQNRGVENFNHDELLQAAKFQVEYYFGQTNYPTDDYLKSHENNEGWIDLALINDFKKMRCFNLDLPELFEMLKKSTAVEVEHKSLANGSEMYRIKKRNLPLNREFGEIFGFNMETIKQLSREQFEIFKENKDEFEEIVQEKFPCIVTTIGSAATKSMMKRKFKRIVIDEATMVKEHEAFIATLHAEQIVLVGDQNQLGPTYAFKVKGPTSMFSRLVQAGHPHSFLDIQYRMHETLMQVPNMLFYKNQIKCGYVGDVQKMFLYSNKPFLFVDVPDGQEEIKGFSFVNF